MTFVLVHGGGFAASCWDRLIPHLTGEVLAVDLPGRGRHPADLATVTTADWAASVIADIAGHGDRGERNVVLVGHSMAGLTLPRVVDLIPERIAHVVFVSCSVPRQGETLAAVLSASFDEQVSLRATEAIEATEPAEDGPTDLLLPRTLAAAMFCNDMDAALTDETLALMVPESPAVLVEPADIRGLRHPVPRTWVRLTEDAIVVPAIQDSFIAHTGGLDVVDLAAGHMAMMSRPAELAAILNQIGGD